ncbi:MAG: HNH endonuclease [Actinobacteria bacterium]|nr:HNH endonuclease [Actinomycetota bacterium]
MHDLLAHVDPVALHPRDAVQILEETCRIENLASAIKLLVADRAVDACEWTRGGYRSPEEWLSHTTGTGYGQARNVLDTSQKLKDLPGLDDALRGGKLSSSQANEVGPAATPENETRLLDAVGSDSAKQLRQRCAKEKDRRRSEEEERARHARIHKNRQWRSWTDGDGWHCQGDATVDVGARIDAAIASEAERVFKAAHAEGRREPAGAYRMDALANLIEGGGAKADTTVVIRVDEARLRGQDGTCETADGAPMPVDVVIGAILAGAFVKVLATDGTDVSRVAHPGRYKPELLRTAINERDGWRCVRPGCGSSHRLEAHHYRVEVRDHGETAYWNLATLCRFCHRLVTNGGHRLEGGPGDWKWIEPP